MRVEEYDVKAGNLLVHRYLYQYHKLQSFFSYHPFLNTSVESRLEWLKERPFAHRYTLVEGLLRYNRKIGNHANAIRNIEQLLREDSCVIVGGQQAGALTGPLYVIHKAITIIQMSKQLQQQTGKAVVPVFWIASEDHDWDEVDHTYVLNWEQQIQRVKLRTSGLKLSINDVQLDSAVFKEFVHDVFDCLPDSPHHGSLKERLLELASISTTLNDFFSRIMSWLFGEAGLVLLDSADEFVRELEKPVFARLIQEDFNQPLQETQDRLVSLGYGSQLDIQESSAHFFLRIDEERKLMLRDEEGFCSKDGQARFRAEELLELLEEDPTRFSSNVASRPIMQETILPVLAFVGGPGEIAYWAQLKPLFDSFQLQMPIVTPRMSFTLIDRRVEKHLASFELSVEDVIDRWEESKQTWLNDRFQFDVRSEFDKLAEEMARVYDPFIFNLLSVEPGIKNIGESARQRLFASLRFLENRTTLALERREEASLKQWEAIRRELMPLDKPQERVYNIFNYLNQYGFDWFARFIERPYAIDGSHKMIYI